MPTYWGKQSQHNPPAHNGHTNGRQPRVPTYAFNFGRRPPSLPLLRLRHDEREAVTIQVDGRPESKGPQLTWVTSVRPATHIGKGQLIVLSAENAKTGIGRVAEITDMYRHWITRLVTGGPGNVYIKIPVAWSRLDGPENIIHTQLYRSLPAVPLPPPTLRNDPLIMETYESPYEFELESAERDDE
ncbi:hypothetical protein EVJ58_g8732 [Rhodofomes roseus]|uniref:Uncharacterized protein n=1 Tax=Rhodofomes roseus TaxID=34475 RepID=A0A4Y9XXZ0_9APHY|nr:hypothetical protein EVJ58_g8732 [Rhodofomes roseus]